MNMLRPFEPFAIQWKGVTMVASIVDVRVDCESYVKTYYDEFIKEYSPDEITEVRLTLECQVDNALSTEYNKNMANKESIMMANGLSMPYRVYYDDNTRMLPLDSIGIMAINDTNKEDKMSYAKKYVNKTRSEEESLAIKEGLICEDGVLTSEGLLLLGQIMLDDNETKDKFYKAVQDLAEKEDK